MRRAGLLLAAFVVLAGSACGGGSSGKAVPPAAPKKVADEFVRELLAGRPEKAAELLASTNSGFQFELPEISIRLQTHGYRVARSRRRDRQTFLYELKGPSSKAVYLVTFERDLDAWRVANFQPVKKF